MEEVIAFTLLQQRIELLWPGGGKLKVMLALECYESLIPRLPRGIQNPYEVKCQPRSKARSFFAARLVHLFGFTSHRGNISTLRQDMSEVNAKHHGPDHQVPTDRLLSGGKHALRLARACVAIGGLMVAMNIVVGSNSRWTSEV